MGYTLRGFRGYLSGMGAINVSGPIRATQFRATADGTAASYAFTWDADENTGMRRIGADNFSLGVGTNQPLNVQQFQINVNEGATFGAGIQTTAFITPAAITGAQNDYAPTGWSGGRMGIFQDLTANANLTGLGATSNGHLIRLFNTSSVAARTLTLDHENAGSTAVNRFTCPNLTAYVLAPGEGVWVQYETGTNRWRVLGTA